MNCFVALSFNDLHYGIQRIQMITIANTIYTFQMFLILLIDKLCAYLILRWKNLSDLSVLV